MQYSEGHLFLNQNRWLFILYGGYSINLTSKKHGFISLYISSYLEYHVSGMPLYLKWISNNQFFNSFPFIEWAAMHD